MRSKTSWLPSFVWMLKRASFSLFACHTIPHLWQRCDPFAMGFASVHEMETSNHRTCLLFLSSWVVAVAGSWCFRGEMEGAARFGLVPEAQTLVVASVGGRGISLDLSGRAWGCPLFQKGVMQCKIPHREWGKCLLPIQFPSYCAHLCISPSGQPSLCYCRYCKDKILQILQC